MFRGVVPRTLRRTLMAAMAWTVYEEVGLIKNNMKNVLITMSLGKPLHFFSDPRRIQKKKRFIILFGYLSCICT